MASFQRMAGRFTLLLAGGLLTLTPWSTEASALNLPRQFAGQNETGKLRERVSINDGWKFWRSVSNPDGVVYETRPDHTGLNGTEELRPWILPSANDFISDPADRHRRPDNEPNTSIPYAQVDFEDEGWEDVTLPHDWAIAGPFYTEDDPIIGGGMGRLPVHGVAWYRRAVQISSEDEHKSVFLDIDGAMSYAMVWLNGDLVGGWPYPYNSFRLDLTSYLSPGDNQLAIRLDNPPDSARWYPGSGLYRNVWLTKVDTTHVGHWGTFVNSRDVTSESATLDIVVDVENHASSSREVQVATDVHELDTSGGLGSKVASFPPETASVPAGEKQSVNATVDIQDPRLWGPPPTQEPNLYVAVTRLSVEGTPVDVYETRFGIRDLEFDPDQGVLVNGEHVELQGVNEHHDLGALGGAFNTRAAERKLEILGEMGVNAIRMAHNPPAPELLELTDRMGFLVMDEVFDSWQRPKTPSDFHLIFDDWHEADLRSMMRRDRNHASVIMWSYGNEVGEQHTDTTPDGGRAIGQRLQDIVQEEDPHRPGTTSMNHAWPDEALPDVVDVISLNYQGAGFRTAPAYQHLEGNRRPPMYEAFREAHPGKVIVTSEASAALSTRGTYLFPVVQGVDSAPVNDSSGGDSSLLQVSAYELYTADFGSSPDRVFASQDRSPFVAGQFVWTGFDYVGEPTPYYSARSSYFGIVDLAGFKKDRFYLYQSRWRSDLPMAHILPHWTWPAERVGEVTPVHVFTAADEAELFVNNKTQGRLRRGDYEYRFRWDGVVYEPGEVRVVTYKDGAEWARQSVRTVGEAAALKLLPDRQVIDADGVDLSFVTAQVVDAQGDVVPYANDTISFSVAGSGALVATDNGNPADMNAFPSSERDAFSGLALAIVRANAGASGEVVIEASAEGLESAQITLTAQ